MRKKFCLIWLFVVVIAQLSEKYLWALFQLIYTGMRVVGGLLEIASGVEMGEILNFVDICNLTSWSEQSACIANSFQDAFPMSESCFLKHLFQGSTICQLFYWKTTDFLCFKQRPECWPPSRNWTGQAVIWINGENQWIFDKLERVE